MCKGAGGIFNFLVATDTAAEQAKVNKAKTEARDAKNERSAAEADLARFNRNLQNKNILDTAGKNYATLGENLGRRLDAATTRGAMASLAFSEELGAYSASAAAAGVGGSSVENYNRTMATMYSLQKEQMDRATDSERYIVGQRMGAVITDAYASLNRDVINPDRDFTDYGPTKGPSVLGNLATLAVAAGVSAAGAPQLGEAILRGKTAQMQARSGNAAGANKSFGQFLGSFQKGVGEISDMFRSNGGVNFGALSDDANSVINAGIGSVTFR